MGKLIDKYIIENPGFNYELTELIQKTKSENSQEIDDLYSTINSLREKLDESLHEKNQAVQQALSLKNDEINQLKLTVSELRQNEQDKKDAFCIAKSIG